MDGATLSGGFTSTLGGTETGSTFDAGGLGGDPCSQGGELTQVGDGFGMVANASGVDFSEIDVLGLDLSLTFANSSAETHVLTVMLDFSNSVDSGGFDAFAESELTLDDAGGEFFFTDVLSDVFFGDKKNGNDLGTFGALVTDLGTPSWDITLGPGETVVWTGAFTLDAGAFEGAIDSNFSERVGSDFSSSFSADLTVVPEPCSMLLLSIGCLAIGKRKSRTGK